MTSAVPPITLPNGVVIDSSTAAQYLWGDREVGLRWFAQLPHLLDMICHRHNITIAQELPDQSMNLVLFGDSATHGPVVIKLAPPHEEIVSEFAMTKHVAGHGYPDVYDGDVAAAWLLMERILPGTTLQELAMSGAISDTDATEVAADLLIRSDIPSPSDGAFPNLRRWLKSLFEYRDRHGEHGPLPDDQVNLALRHADWLLELKETPRLLHGDFHHGNMIQGSDGWMMIDPKGVIAPIAFELGPWFYNPLEVDKRPNLAKLFTKRMDIFEARLGIDRVTMWRAVFVACVLSDCWTVEDAHPEYCHHSTITKALLELPEANT